MKITQAEIFRLCKKEDTFYKGKRYFESGRIKKLSTDKINSFEEYIEARVSGTHNYNVSIWTENNRLDQAVCDCPAFEKYDGICKHIAAVLFSFAEKTAEEPEPKNETISSSPEARRIIENYKNALGAAPVGGSAEKAKLYPTLRIYDLGDYRAEFKIGIPKKYVIKDLCAFAKDVENCAESTYGKNGVFVHSKQAFDFDSAAYVDFICKAAKENRCFNRAYNKYYYITDLKSRDLPLSPVLLDEFFDAAEGRRITVERGGESRTVNVIKKNPRLSFSFSKNSDSSVFVRQDKYMFLSGDKRLYIFTGDTAFMTDGDYKKAMEGIIGANASCVSAEGFVVSNSDMTFFYNRILPQISKYSNIYSEPGFLSQFELPEPKIKFYVDCPKLSYVTLHCGIDYGKGEKNPFSGEDRSGYKDDITENIIKNLIMHYFPVSDNGLFKIEDNDDLIFEFAVRGIEELKEKGEVFVSEGFERIKIKEPPKISVGLSIKSDILNLEFSAEDFDLNELKKLLKSYRRKIRYHRLKDGSFLRLDEDDDLTKIAETADALNLFDEKDFGGAFELPKYRALYLDKIFSKLSGTVRDSGFKSLIRDIKTAEDSDYEVPAELKSILRSYQKHGFRWLKTMDKCGFGGILADDMGLGKTLQIITLLLCEKRCGGAENDFGPLALIVCPASLVYNWESEIEHFAPSLMSIIITGTAAERKERLENAPKGSVIITSYDLLKRDEELYKDLKFRYQIIDEAQYIKNSSTQSARSVKSIDAVTKFALTGTPVENRLSELWSIFDYLMPGFLFSYGRFKTELEAPALKDGDRAKLERIKNMVSPFILRRIKSDVLKELPEKVENIFMCRLEGEQKLAYGAGVKELKDSLEKSGMRGEGAIKILAMLTRLRQLCCDPHLCYENYGGGSAKLESAVTLIKNAIEGGHKVLLFSQFTSMLEIIAKRLEGEEIPFYILTGTTSKEERISLVNSFQTDSVPVFLISLKAGGTGLNLTAADVVIHFDPWWNVAAQNQATDRTHRIGQKKAVTVYKLIAKNTIEEKILKLQESKKNLADAVITGENISLAKMSEEELISLLGGE